MSGRTVSLTIEHLGHRGDGVAFHEDRTLHIPGTLPGERITAEVGETGARLISVDAPSTKRVAPICPYFGRCGGCAVQHLAPKSYRSWKRSLISNALAQRGITEPKVASIAVVPPGSRRRAVLHAASGAEGVVFGYFARASGDIVDLDSCPLLVPAIDRRLSELRVLAGRALQRASAISMQVTATDTGLDVNIDVERGRPADPQQLIGKGLPDGIARLTMAGETVAMAAQPALTIGGGTVHPPPGAFLQATAQSERAMADAVMTALAGSSRIADLFCGLGTFTLRLAARAPVLAVDGWQPALTALEDAVNRRTGLKPVEIVRRDLAASPLTARDLGDFDAALFDPPRAGAEAQAREIASSQVPLVVAVSCNPATFARDARILLDGGYRLVSIAAVDQFLFSAHIEIVAILKRD